MSRFGALVLMVLLCGLAGCGGPQRVVPSWDDAVAPEALAKAGLEFYWQLAVELHAGEELAGLWHRGENLYVLTNTNRIITYDAARGLRRWSRQVTETDQSVFPPVHIDGLMLPPRPGPHTEVTPPPRESYRPHDVVIFNTVTYALVLERATGELLHLIDFSPGTASGPLDIRERALAMGDTGFAANTGTATDGEMLYVGSIRGPYYALSLVSGVVHWVRGTDGIISAQPIYRDGRLYVASLDGRVHVTDTVGEPDPVWTSEATGGLSADIALDERGVFAGSLDRWVYAFDFQTGQTLWRFRTRGPVRNPIQLGRAAVYAQGQGDALYAIDLVTGDDIFWQLPDGDRVLLEMDRATYVLSVNRALMVVNAAGELATTVPMAGLDLFVPSLDEPLLFVGSRSGRLGLIRPLGAGHLTPDQLRRTAGAAVGAATAPAVLEP